MVKRDVPVYREHVETDSAESTLLSLIESEPFPKAVQDYFSEGGKQSTIKKALDTRSEGWRIFFPEELAGKHLDIQTALGKRSRLISEQSTEVHAIGSGFRRALLLKRISEELGQQVNPLRAKIDSPPYPNHSFDSTFLRSTVSGLSEQLAAIDRLLKPTGTAFIESNGWPREARFTDLVGIEHDETKRDARVTSAIRSTAYNYRNIAHQNGFESVKIFARLSLGTHRNQCLFSLENREAIGWLLSTDEYLSDSGLFKLLKTGAKIGSRTGLLKHCFPEYLIVAKKNGEIQVNEEIDLLLAGKNRSTGIKLSEGEVTEVIKYPNSKRQGSFTNLEHRVSEEISSRCPNDFADSLPTGTAEITQFGFTRREQPVTGEPLDERFGESPEQFEEVTGIAFEWIIRLQDELATNRRCQPAAEVKRELSVASASPPADAIDSVELFSTPVHGDYFGSNIYVDSGAVSSVIDWERAGLSENPFTDPAYFLLQYADYLGETFQQGFHKVFLDDNAYTEVSENAIDEYCSSVGISVEEFLLYLPYPYIRLHRMDRAINHWVDSDWIKRAKYIWDRYDALSESIQPTTSE